MEFAKFRKLCQTAPADASRSTNSNEPVVSPDDFGKVNEGRVLIYGMNYRPEPTGVGRYTGEIGSFLVEEGSAVEVITAVPHYPGWSIQADYQNWYSVQQGERIRITRCPLMLRKDMRGVWRVLAPLSFAIASAPIAIWRIVITRPNTVLCIEPTLFAAPVALLAAWLVGARTVLHVQDLEIDAAFAVGHIRSIILQRLAYAFEGIVLRAFDRVITISNRMRDHLITKGVIQSRVSVVRNWVDLERIGPLGRPSIYRADLNLAERDFVAVYAGNIGAKQALSIVLEAAARLSTEPNIKFVIAGEGPEKERLIAHYGHLSNVMFLPVQPEGRLCELLNLADVHLLPQSAGAADLVLPSKLGGMLASGKPSIIMADPGTELYEFVGDGSVVLAPGSSDLLADAIWRSFCNGPVSRVDNEARVLQLDAKRNLSRFRDALVGRD